MRNLIPLMEKAMSICNLIRQKMQPKDTVLKADLSPLTVADIAIQAFFTVHLLEIEPQLTLLGEESSNKLNSFEIVERSAAYLQDAGERISAKDIVRLLDNRQNDLSSCWILDPIDGTKGFLRNDQYAIALALKVEQKIVAGIVGAPNLFPEGNGFESRRGYIFYASSGMGAYRYNPQSKEERKIHVSALTDLEQIRVVASLEKGHADQNLEEQILRLAKISQTPLRLDSLVKYCLIACGEAELYLRIPHSTGYRARVWDHAAGEIILTEAGGQVSDLSGKPLDYSYGVLLKENSGILATNGLIHKRMLDVLRRLR